MCVLRHCLAARFALRQNLEVELFVGTYRSLARVRLLDADALADGASGWAQLQVREPLVAVRGDRFVVRLPSPSATLGGGAIVDVHPRRRYKPGQPDVLARLAALASGEPEQIALQLLDAGPLPLRQLVADSGLAAQAMRDTLRALREGGAAMAPRPASRRHA
jgi:selenocysteine-specific elongation factor